MGAIYQQIPGPLDIVCVPGDELNIGLGLDVDGEPIDLTGYTLTAIVYQPELAGGGSWSSSEGLEVGDTVATFTISPVDLEGGLVNLGLSETQTAAVSTATSHRWYLRWQDTEGQTLTIASGTFTARIP